MNRQQRRKLEKQNNKSGGLPVVQNSAPAAPPQGRIEEGVQLYNAKQYSVAESIFRDITASYPAHAHSFFLLGAILEAQGNRVEAIAAYEQATAKNPANGDYHNNLALLYESSGAPDRAIISFEKSIQVNPQNFIARYNLGNTLTRLDRPEQAIEHYQSACALDPNQHELHMTLAATLISLHHYEDAIVSLEKAKVLNPSHAPAHHGLGNCYKYLHQPEKSILHFKQAIELEPENASHQYALAFPLLLSGRIQEGLDGYETRFQNSVVARQFSQPAWDGKSDLSGQTILVWAEQGLADTVKWASAVPKIIANAGHCIIECQPKLASIMQRSFPHADVREEDFSNDLTREDIDTHIPMGSLYHRFHSHLDLENPIDAYLIPDPQLTQFWKDQLTSLGDGLKIGISWASPHITRKRAALYTQLMEWIPILKTPGAHFVNLQCMNYEEDLKNLHDTTGLSVHNFEDLDTFHDIEAATALIKNLDVVISIDTAVGTIAAAAGTPIWQLTWRQNHWNTLINSLRGPNVTYFYRETQEPWDNAINAAVQQLADFK